MRNYRIFHPVGGVLNTQLKRGVYEYEQICSIDAKSLEEAFKLAQNDFSERYASLGKRSTSVGDIIVDVREERHYFVHNVGFGEPIPHTVTQYIDWGNH